MTHPFRVPFVRDAAMTGGAQFLQAFCALLGGILVARVLGPSGKGTISVLTALASMTVLIASLGVNFSCVYFLGRFRSERNEIMSNSYVFGVLGGFAAAVALTLTGIVFDRALLNGISVELLLIFVMFVPFNYFNKFAQVTLLAQGRILAFNFPQLATGGALFFGTAAVLLVFGPHVAPLLAMRVAAEALVTLVLVVYIHRAVRFRFQPSMGLLRRQIRYGVKNYASSLMWVVLLQSDLVLCNHFLGSGQAGIYSVAVSFGLPMTLVGSVLGVLIFQRVSSSDNRAARIQNTNQVMRMLVAISMAISIILAVSAPVLVPFLYGASFSGATAALFLLLPGLFALSLETVLMNFMAGEGSPPIVYRAPIIGVLMNVSANMFVIPHWGINGASVTSTLSYCVVLAMVMIHYLRSTSSFLRDLTVLRRRDLSAVWGRAQSASPSVSAADVT